jgi:hypothetical protein
MPYTQVPRAYTFRDGAILHKGIQIVPEPGGTLGDGAVISGEGIWTVPETSVAGDVVCISGTYTAELAVNTDPAKMPVMAIVLSKPTTVTARLVYLGEAIVTPSEVIPINPSPGLPLFASATPGKLTSIKPPTGICQEVCRVASSGGLVILNPKVALDV